MIDELVESLSREVIEQATANNFSSKEIEEIKKAIYFAINNHGDQKRKSGELYVTHPLNVAKILLTWGMDKDTICAGILHDIVEDTNATLEDIRNNFNESIEKLVDAVTKVSVYSDKNRANLNNKTGIHSTDEENKNNDTTTMSIIKVFMGMSKDIRVILIKIADRLHNMRTIKHLKHEKQVRIALETKDIYANIASRLGMYRVKNELDDLCLKVLEPKQYKKVKTIIEKKVIKNGHIHDDVCEKINILLKNNHLAAEVVSRVKSVSSTYEKIKNGENINDIFAIRIILDKTLDCYLCLGIIHCNYMNKPNSFKDYISSPKMNLYQSLHTTITIKDLAIEVQIRTKDMDFTANYGIAAHWKYKGNLGINDKDNNPIPLLVNELNSEKIGNSISVIKKIAKQSFISVIDKADNTTKTIPDDINLIDCAFIFNKSKFDYIKNILVNDHEEMFSYQPQQGDYIQINYSSQKTIDKKWENYSRLQNVKKHIESEILKKHQSLVNSSEKFIEKISKHSCGKMDKDEILSFLKKHFNINSINEFIEVTKAIYMSEEEICQLFDSNYANRKDKINYIKNNYWKWLISKSLFESDDLNCFFNELKITECCSKVPPLSVVGVIKSNVLEVHNYNCPKVNEKEKLVVLKWDKIKIKKSSRSFKARVMFVGNFTPEISNIIISTITRFRCSINHFNLTKNKQKNEFIINAILYVKNYSNIEKIANELLSKGYINDWKFN